MIWFGERFRYSIPPTAPYITAVVLIFLMFVFAGISGSSLTLGFTQSPFIETQPKHVRWLPQPIRSDEWALLTPLAISQTTHSPAFPILNRNLGIDGQNMLVVNMTGVPVAHISTLAKPATWGFFFLDLKRALAWYWWFPVFGCLLALWGLFSLLIPGRWRLAIALSAWFCLSAYLTAWSYWPAYAVFFPSMALWSAILILRGQPVLRLCVLTVVLGLSLAGFVFILYPPWQVSLGYLFLFLSIGLVVRDRLYRNVDATRLAVFGIAMAIAGVLVFLWWVDARQAVQLIRDTVYPGKRTTVLGGSVSVAELLRGTTNVASLYRLAGPEFNQSEVASFVYLFAPLLVAIAFFNRYRTVRTSRVVEWVMLIFVCWTLTIMMIGIPEFIATGSLWGQVPGRRPDLALGLAYVLLCGLVLTPMNVAARTSWRLKSWTYLVAFVWAVFLVYASHRLPAGVLIGLSLRMETASFVVAFLSGVWLMQGDARKFLAISIAWSAYVVMSFNPLVVGPSEVRVTPQLQSELPQSASPSPNRPRVLVLAGQIPAMYLLAAGVPVANGIFYYPQPTLWKHLDPNKQYSDIYNRFHHLVFVTGDVKSPSGFQLETPQADVVRVVLAPDRFRFSLTGAQMVVAPAGIGEELKLNSSLKFIQEGSGWSWFRVEE